MNKIIHLIVILYSVQSFGWQESFGGDPAIADFKYKAFEFINFAYKHNNLNPFNQDKKSLNQQFDKADFYCKEDLYVNNSKVLAINYPYANPKKIELDCNGYNQLSETDKANLVIHETLSVFEIMDTDYRQSFKLSAAFKEYLLGLSANHQDFIGYIANCDLDNFSKIKASGYYLNFIYNKASAIEYAIAYGCSDIFDYLVDHKIDIPTTSVLFPSRSNNNIAFQLTSLALEGVLFFKKNDDARKKLEIVKKMLSINPELNNVKYSEIFYFNYQNGYTPSYKFQYDLDWSKKVTLQLFFNSATLILLPDIKYSDSDDLEIFRTYLNQFLNN